jgi:hypothetical protein
MNRVVKAHCAKLSGEESRPATTIVPILRAVESGKLKSVGTGVSITRYGLVMAAQPRRGR